MKIFYACSLVWRTTIGRIRLFIYSFSLEFFETPLSSTNEKFFLIALMLRKLMNLNLRTRVESALSVVAWIQLKVNAKRKKSPRKFDFWFGEFNVKWGQLWYTFAGFRFLQEIFKNLKLRVKKIESKQKFFNFWKQNLKFQKTWILVGFIRKNSSKIKFDGNDSILDFCRKFLYKS